MKNSARNKNLCIDAVLHVSRCGVKTNLNPTGTQGSGDFSQIVGVDEEGQAGDVYLILTHYLSKN